jgi:hypothetical protein
MHIIVNVIFGIAPVIVVECRLWRRSLLMKWKGYVRNASGLADCMRLKEVNRGQERCNRRRHLVRRVAGIKDPMIALQF